MSTYDNSGKETSPTTEAAPNNPGAPQQAQENIEQIVELLESTDWRNVPSFTVPEAAVLAERFAESADRLEESHR